MFVFFSSGAKDSYLQVPNSAVTPFITEMNHLHNQSHINKAKLEAETALAKERASHAELKLQMKQQRSLTDRLQTQIETLEREKINLQFNKTTLGKAAFQAVFGVLYILWLKWWQTFSPMQHMM